MTHPLLELSGVTVRFGGLVALDEVSLQVPSGHVVGVIGPNGAGKTTLFNVVCGFVRPGAGSVRWQGADITGHRPHHLAGLGVARTLQGLGLFPGLTVLQNVMVGATRHARTGVPTALPALPAPTATRRRCAAGPWNS
jgi:branched-chain amino acid transport system ATP-binding protein